MKYRMGWLPDHRDLRDYTYHNFEFKPKLDNPPQSVDLREWCSPIEAQMELGSCTAQAGVGLIEFYEIKNHDKWLNGSRLFLYKTTRNLMKVKGDTGAYLRTTMGAIRLFGVPPEDYWPYTDAPKKFDLEPPPFCYAFAQNFKALKYFRHDPYGKDPKHILFSVKMHLAHGRPSMFGFAVYSSIEDVKRDGIIPFPKKNESLLGGHAIVAVGYDDKLNALLIRNSWGIEWGDNGYGWLPYDYVLKGLAEDFWSITQKECVDVEEFGE